MMQRLYLLLSVFCGLTFAAPTLACSCMTERVDPQEYLRTAALVFEGEVLSTPVTSWLRNTVTLRVLEPMKGRMGAEVTLDQTQAGLCMEVFVPGKKMRVAAYGNAEDGYATYSCSQIPLHPQFQGDEIWALAVSNRQHTLALGGADISVADAATLRRLIRWYSDYGSFEDGLDAVSRLLIFEPGDPEALAYERLFQSAIKSPPHAP